MIVYLVTNLVNDKKYVGKTIKTLPKRWSVHKAHAKKGSQFYFHKALMKHGFHNFKTEILFEVGDHDDCVNLEKDMIVRYRTRDPKYGYNLTDGGEGIPGKVMSQETERQNK